MIKINLLGNDTAVDRSSTYLISGYVLSIVICLGICFFLYSAVNARVQELTQESELLEVQLAKLQETTTEVKALEVMKKELNSKLSVIATLKKSKMGPVRVLDDLNMAVPERAWLTEVREVAGRLRIVGLALDNQTIVTFIKDLEASDYFMAVDLIQTKQVPKQGVKMKEFTVQAKINYAGKITSGDPEVGVDGAKGTVDDKTEV